MIQLVFLTSALLVGQAAAPPQSKKAEKPPAKIARDIDPAEALAKYNELRETTAPTAAAQWKLGLWCEDHGLKAEALVHFAEVVRRDPKREAAWRKLGFKKSGGRWTTGEQIAADLEQKKADKIWAPRIRKLHKDIHGANGTKKRDQARAELDAIADPRAIPALYRAFGVGGPSHQRILVQVLGQIDKPLSTKVLAMLAVYGTSPEVRQRATQTLRGRPPEDYLDLLVGLMVDPLKYEVKPVGGPGSPGVLFVEGEQFNVSRYYAPPPAPNITLQSGDAISFDQFGMPTIGVPRYTVNVGAPRGVAGSKTLVRQRQIVTYAEISPAQMMMEAQRGAVMAQGQLENDVAAIKSINADRTRFNDRVMAIAKDATGKDRGETPKEWRDALAVGNNSSKQPSKAPVKLTFNEMVPLAYNPVFAPVGFMSQNVVNTYADS